MNTINLVWKNIRQQWGATLLSILLTAFGVAILSVIYIAGDTFEKQLDTNSKNIDLVIGAKGSPLQLILSTLYHVDNPTGNISLHEAKQIADNPLIQQAVPISLGDNFKGHRIIGTDPTFLPLYNLKISEGNIWAKSFEVVIGAEVAAKHNLQIGQHIHGAHGLSADAHVHDDHPFTIVGVLEKAGNVVDNLILCNLESVWEVHGIHHDHEHIHDHAEEHAHEHDPDIHEHSHNDAHEHEHEEETLVTEKPRQDVLIKSIGEGMIEDQGVEITALLVQYSSPSAIAVIPRMVNQSTHMQAASPAIESSRIFSLLGVGLDSLAVLAYVIMVIAGLSIFISLYNALKERKYDMAIMRTMGATKTKLFFLILVEGLMITLIGGLIGLIFGHLALYLINTQASQSTAFIEAFKLYPMELIILWVAIALGAVAALIPAFKAYSTTISKTLASK
jgi:putative ABC transport system permease protein